MRDLDDLLDRGLSAVTSAGPGEVEVYVEERAVFRVTVAGGEIESLESQELKGAGLRLFNEGRVAFGYTTDLSEEGLASAAAGARDFLSCSDPDESNGLPEPDESSSPEPDNYDAMLMRIDQRQKLSLARRVEEAARGFDKQVAHVRQSLYTDVLGRIGIANSGGLRRTWPFSRAYASIDLTAEKNGETQSGWNSEFGVRFSSIDPAHVGREAARRAVQKLGAERAPTRRYNLVLDPVVTASLMDAISPVLHADNVLKGKSLLATRMGQEVGSSRVTLLDDGRIDGGDRSAAYDAEGVATRCTLLIDGGVLKDYLHSSYTSMRMGTPPTGNSYRTSFTAPPRIAPSTLSLQPTGMDRDQLLAEAGDGIYITEVMGLHTIDPISGDFSLGAAGLTLSQGRPDRPVDRIGIAGNILDLLRSIASVANDRRFVPGSGAGSSTLLTDITVSGT